MKILAPSLTFALCATAIAFSVLPSMAQTGTTKKVPVTHAMKTTGKRKMVRRHHSHKVAHHVAKSSAGKVHGTK